MYRGYCPARGRMLPDILPVSELISMWQKIREATGLAGAQQATEVDRKPEGDAWGEPVHKLTP